MNGIWWDSRTVGADLFEETGVSVEAGVSFQYEQDDV